MVRLERWEGGEIGKVGGWEGWRVMGGKVGGSWFYSR